MDAIAALVMLSLAQVRPAMAPAAVQAGRAMNVGAPMDPPTIPPDADLARVEVSPELLRLARALDGEHHSERASARESIVARKVSPDELMALLVRTDFGPEARNALVAILRDRIITAPRGALGVRMEGIPDPDGGVRISGLVQGMPAERVLRVDDVLEKVNGRSIMTQAELIRSVQSLPPGAEVRLAVRRPKRDDAGKPVVDADGKAVVEAMELPVRLGSTDDLEQRDDQRAIAGGAGGVVNAVSIERQLLAAEAARRFLPDVRKVEFPDRARAIAAARPTPTVDSLRKRLMEYQLSGGDIQLVSVFRTRLDAIALRAEKAATSEDKKRINEDLEILDSELRGAE